MQPHLNQVDTSPLSMNTGTPGSYPTTNVSRGRRPHRCACISLPPEKGLRKCSGERRIDSRAGIMRARLVVMVVVVIEGSGVGSLRGGPEQKKQRRRRRGGAATLCDAAAARR